MLLLSFFRVTGGPCRLPPPRASTPKARKGQSANDSRTSFRESSLPRQTESQSWRGVVGPHPPLVASASSRLSAYQTASASFSIMSVSFVRPGMGKPGGRNGTKLSSERPPIVTGQSPNVGPSHDRDWMKSQEFPCNDRIDVRLKAHCRTSKTIDNNDRFSLLDIYRNCCIEMYISL